MQYSDDEMWRAARECDKSSDGEFLYAVKTVGVYCHPSCRSRTPLRRNVVYFADRGQAEDAGYRACKRCRPDLGGFAPAAELAQRAERLICKCFGDRALLAREMGGLGVSSGHLAEIFRSRYGISLLGYATNLRNEHARRLLAETDTAIIKIASDTGFDNLSSFYAFFKKHNGMTPNEFRKKAGAVY